MPTAFFKQITKHLTDIRPPRVWSLLVTVFGELAQQQGAQISGSLLRELSAQMGIKPEAMRVALHRLRKDGWIESTRTGRTSDYFLTPWGRAQSMQASPRIYATGPAADAAWLVVSNPGRPARIDDGGGAWVSSSLLITSAPPAVVDIFATPLRPEDTMPMWMTGKVCDVDTVRASQDFSAAMGSLRKSLGPDPQLNRFEVAALRVLLVHSWRRIVLKTPGLPDYVFPAGWSGARCRASVFMLLNQFPKPDLEDLERQLSATKIT